MILENILLRCIWLLHILPKLTIGSTKGFIHGKALSTEGHSHSTNDITGGILPATRGGTGYTSLAALKSALGIPSTTPIGFTQLMSATRTFATSGTNAVATPTLNYPSSAIFVYLRIVITSMTFIGNSDYNISQAVGPSASTAGTHGLLRDLPAATNVSTTISNRTAGVMFMRGAGGIMCSALSGSTGNTYIIPSYSLHIGRAMGSVGIITYSNVNAGVYVTAYGINGLSP